MNIVQLNFARNITLALFLVSPFLTLIFYYFLGYLVGKYLFGVIAVLSQAL